MRHLCRYQGRVVSFAATLLYASLTHAQTAAPIEQTFKEGLRRQEERTRQQQQDALPRSDVLKPADKSAADQPIPSDTPCFEIKDIRLDGAAAQTHAWLIGASQAYLGRCLGVNALAHLANHLNTKLLERGLATTKISILPQNLSSGILSLTLNIGRISRIEMVNAGKLDDGWGTFKNAFPVSEGDVLNIFALEQGVEQMKRLGSQSEVGTQIQPGEAPDTSIIAIERKAIRWSDRIRGGITVDNGGSAALGRTQLSAYVSVDNLAGINDALTISGNTNAERPTGAHRSQSISLNYSIPWDYNLFSISASASRFAQLVQGTTAVFVSSGTSDSIEGRWSHTLWRNSSQKFGLYSAATLRSSDSFIEDTELVVQRRHTSNFDLGATYKYLYTEGTVEADLGYRRGVTWWHAQEDLSATDADPNPATLRPKLWLFNASVTRDFKWVFISEQPLKYTASLRVQHTRDHTLSADQIGIGSRYTVRGFDGNTVLLAEGGAVLRQEVSSPMPPILGIEPNAYLALDYGRVWGHSADALSGRQLAGTALGLRGKRGPLSFDAGLGAPISKPSNFSTNTPSVYLTSTYAF